MNHELIEFLVTCSCRGWQSPRAYHINEIKSNIIFTRKCDIKMSVRDNKKIFLFTPNRVDFPNRLNHVTILHMWYMYSVTDSVRKCTIGRKLSRWRRRLWVMGPVWIYVKNRYGRSSHECKVRIIFLHFT